jgi:hypothetical protein
MGRERERSMTVLVGLPEGTIRKWQERKRE